MSGPNLTAEQNQNLLIGYGAANTVYDINNTQGANLVKDQPLKFVPDMVNQPGYSQLRIDAPAGFVVKDVIKNQPSGLDAFIAFNPNTNADEARFHAGALDD